MPSSISSTKTIFDLIIIGGGVNGCAIAADASLKGLNVCLIEKGSLASGTSSASSNLIHGGLRYLEQYDFKLVREALKEQVIWQQRAPHLVKPLPFILPYEKHLRPHWLLRIGLWIYDHLYLQKQLPKTKKVNRNNSEYFNKLKNNLNDGFCYYDCETQGAAITVANARLAKNHGATLLTQTTFKSATLENNLWQVQCSDAIDSFNLQAKALINAAGPWVESINQAIQPHGTDIHIQKIKGSHIIVPKCYDGNHAYILQNKDNRIVFALPYANNMTAIGTTDIIYQDDLDAIKINQNEKKYLCDLINQYFTKSISTDDIISSWSGVRALATHKKEDASSMSREHKVQLNVFQNAPLMTILGGKLTNSRLVAEEAINKLKAYLTFKNHLSTKNIALPGGDLTLGQLKALEKQLQQNYAFIDAHVIARWIRLYGSEIKDLLNGVKTKDNLGQDFGSGLYALEVDFLVNHFFAESAEDILFRLTRFKAAFSEEQIAKLKGYLDR